MFPVIVLENVYVPPNVPVPMSAAVKTTAPVRPATLCTGAPADVIYPALLESWLTFVRDDCVHAVPVTADAGIEVNDAPEPLKVPAVTVPVTPSEVMPDTAPLNVTPPSNIVKASTGTLYPYVVPNVIF
jgi:hypothetical protein